MCGQYRLCYLVTIYIDIVPQYILRKESYFRIFLGAKSSISCHSQTRGRLGITAVHGLQLIKSQKLTACGPHGLTSH
jgi:hypothetical protein